MLSGYEDSIELQELQFAGISTNAPLVFSRDVNHSPVDTRIQWSGWVSCLCAVCSLEEPGLMDQRKRIQYLTIMLISLDVKS